MKPTLLLAVVLSLVAAATNAPAEEGKDQPAGGAAGRVGRLRSQLKSSAPETREAAATELGAVAVDASVNLLVATLAADPAERVRLAAARSLGLLRAHSARAPLSRAASHDASPLVRKAANVALQQLRSASNKPAHATRLARRPSLRPRALGVGYARAHRSARPPDYYSGLAKLKGGTFLGIGGTVAGAGLMVAALMTSVAGPSKYIYVGRWDAQERIPNPRYEGSEVPTYLLVAGCVTIGVSIISGLILRGVGSNQMSKALDARNKVTISSSSGQFDLAWTF